MTRAVHLALVSSGLLALACFASACAANSPAIRGHEPSLAPARVAKRAEPLAFVGHGAGARRIDAIRE